MDKLKILIACHKEAEVPYNEVYMPLHVGKALAPDVDLGFHGDNTGNNISEKNGAYCELTAQYWGWKNLDCEYIGLQHYRRYFKPIFTNDNVENLLGGADIILATPRHLKYSVDHYLMLCLIPEDVTLFYLAFKLYDPKLYSKAEKYFIGNLFYPCNMFVCRKDLFDMFAEWQFGLLKKMEDILPKSSYSRERRIIGYLAETLLPIWFIGNSYSFRTFPIVNKPGNSDGPCIRTRIKYKVQNILFDLIASLCRHKHLNFNGMVLSGLRQDGFVNETGLITNTNME